MRPPNAPIITERSRRGLRSQFDTSRCQEMEIGLRSPGVVVVISLSPLPRLPVYPQLLQSPPPAPPLFSYWRTKDRVPAWSSRVPSLLLPPTCATPFSALVPSLHLPLYTPLSLDSIARLRFLGHAIPSAHLGQAQALPWLLSDILVGTHGPYTLGSPSTHPSCG
ncbi:unnamed protein product [Penicillium roqueforti FM164]|uniref:Genomic scaffold, ProqFM164S01 n=1 Tax=Penicillium roqueforti (strain FM164) TaxID=1365484 RepID=W6Q021_PENRF|nr:unnamed protein product [Penicillium roqueforti FM164]